MNPTREKKYLKKNISIASTGSANNYKNYRIKPFNF